MLGPALCYFYGPGCGWLSGPAFMVVAVGPPATRNREPGQTRKGAAAAVEACAGVWLAETATPLMRADPYGFLSVRDPPTGIGYTAGIPNHPTPAYPAFSDVLSGTCP